MSIEKSLSKMMRADLINNLTSKKIPDDVIWHGFYLFDNYRKTFRETTYRSLDVFYALMNISAQINMDDPPDLSTMFVDVEEINEKVNIILEEVIDFIPYTSPLEVFERYRPLTKHDLYVMKRAIFDEDIMSFSSEEIASAVRDIVDSYPGKELDTLCAWKIIKVLKKYLNSFDDLSPMTDYAVEILNYDGYTKSQSINSTIPSFVINPLPIIKYESSDYRRVYRIGFGTYAEVYRISHKETGELKALKIYQCDCETFDTDDECEDCDKPCICYMQGFLREFVALTTVDHPNVIKIEMISITQKTSNLVMELMDCNLLNFNSKIGMSSIPHVLREILKGVKACHDKKIFHLDIKPQNILLKNGIEIIKLCDFNISRLKRRSDDMMTTSIITICYRPPEIILGKQEYGSEVDIWSIGCVFYELIKKGVLFYKELEKNQVNLIFETLGYPDNIFHDLPNHYMIDQKEYPIKELKIEGLSNAGCDLLNKMLQVDPVKRISIDDALAHPYFLE